MFSILYNYFINLFDCAKIQNEQCYQEIIFNQEQDYYSRNALDIDPLWQDRRILTFFSKNKNNKLSI